MYTEDGAAEPYPRARRPAGTLIHLGGIDVEWYAAAPGEDRWSEIVFHDPRAREAAVCYYDEEDVLLETEEAVYRLSLDGGEIRADGQPLPAAAILAPPVVAVLRQVLA